MNISKGVEITRYYEKCFLGNVENVALLGIHDQN